MIVIEIASYVSKTTGTNIIVSIANLATTVANLIEFCYLYYYYRKQLNEIKYEILTSVHTEKIRTMIVVREIIKVSIPMAITPFIGAMGRNVDSTTIINGLQTNMNYETAKIQYGILNGKVDTLINFPLSFSGTVSTALVPSVASANSKNTLKDLDKRINKSLIIGLLIAMPSAAVYFFYSEEILKLLFPNAYQGSLILQISSLSIIIVAIEQTMRGILIGIGNNTIPIITVIIGTIIRIVLNLILIPLNSFIGGINGAAISNLISNIIVTVIGCWWIKHRINIKIDKKNIMKLLVSTLGFIIMSKIIFEILKNTINAKVVFIISIIIGIIFYFILILLFDILNTKQLQRLSFRQKKGKKPIKIVIRKSMKMA